MTTAHYELTAEEVSMIRTALLFMHAYGDENFRDIPKPRMLELYNNLHWPGPELR